jgi:hypothetical protein
MMKSNDETAIEFSYLVSAKCVIKGISQQVVAIYPTTTALSSELCQYVGGIGRPRTAHNSTLFCGVGSQETPKSNHFWIINVLINMPTLQSRFAVLDRDLVEELRKGAGTSSFAVGQW